MLQPIHNHLSPELTNWLDRLQSSDKAVRLQAALFLVSGELDLEPAMPVLRALQVAGISECRRLATWILTTVEERRVQAA
jgi:hypothetical protein